MMTIATMTANSEDDQREQFNYSPAALMIVIAARVKIKSSVK